MSVAELNGLAVAGLKQAMRATGVEGNAAAFTRLLRQEAGDGPDPTTVGRWLRGEQTVPAWALLAASRASGVSPTDLLLPDADVSDLRRIVDDLRRQMTELRTSIAATGTEGQSRRASLSEVEGVLAVVRRQLSDAAEELNLPWEEPPADEQASPDTAEQLERLERVVGLLQARMMDVQTTLGLQWRAPRRDPETAENAVSALFEAAGLLTQQMQEVADSLRDRRTQQTNVPKRRRAAESGSP